MKLYNIHPIKKSFPWGDMYVIVLGEEGRARKQSLIPFSADPINLDGDDFEIGLTMKGYPKIIRGESSDGYIALLSGEGVYTRGTYGTVYIHPEDKEKIFLISYGKGAFGIAGRIGEWYEFLILIKPEYPVRFYVRPAGGEYKIERYFKIFFEEKVIDLKKEEKEIFEEETGISLGDVEEYIDLVSFIKND
jgi:hypothetical protein